MSGLGWQDAVAALLAAGALGWIVRRKLRAGRRAALCDDCPSCAPAATSSGEHPAQETFVRLEMSPRAKKS